MLLLGARGLVGRQALRCKGAKAGPERAVRSGPQEHRGLGQRAR